MVLGSMDTPVTQLTSTRAVSTTPATAVNLADVPCTGVVIQALPTNSNLVAVGGAAALATVGAEAGTLLEAGQEITIYCTNTNRIYFDVITSGEGICYTILK